MVPDQLIMGIIPAEDNAEMLRQFQPVIDYLNKDLKGKTFAFVDPASTSGHLYPLKALKDAGMDPEKDLKSTTYAGGHDAVELAVKNGTVDAGADDDSTYDRMLKEGAISKDKNVIFWKSEPIPGSPIAVRGDLPKKLKQKIQDSFLSMTADKLGGPIAYDEAIKYAKVSDKTYDGVRSLVDNLGLDLEKLANE